MSFRIGLFGLDKLMNIDRTVSLFEQALKQVETAKKRRRGRTAILLSLELGFLWRIAGMSILGARAYPRCPSSGRSSNSCRPRRSYAR